MQNTAERNCDVQNENKGTGCPYLTSEQIETIAEKAADKAVKKMTDQLYMEVGKSVVNKVFLVCGIVSAAGYFWLKDKGVF